MRIEDKSNFRWYDRSHTCTLSKHAEGIIHSKFIFPTRGSSPLASEDDNVWGGGEVGRPKTYPKILTILTKTKYLRIYLLYKPTKIR